MIKIAIADDELMIREGLAKAFDWNAHGFELVGLCKNGQEAYDLAISVMPDIFLLDICMPKISGLELIKRLNNIYPKMTYIIITGYSEFEYAHQAIQLGVYDFVVKPIDEEKLLFILIAAKEMLLSDKKDKEKVAFIYNQITEHLEDMQIKFINKLVTKGFDSEDLIKSELNNLELDFGGSPGLILIKHISHISGKNKWSDQLLYFAYKNLLSEMLEGVGKIAIISKDLEDMLFAVTAINSNKNWQKFASEFEKAALTYLGQQVRVSYKHVESNLLNCHEIYNLLQSEIRIELSDNVLFVKRYLENDFGNNDIDLNSIASKLAVSPSHLSRQIRKELGITFKEYLIQLRINRAIELIAQSNLRINEVAERVGYTNQHYFAHSFKKATGYSPSDYRQRHHD